MEIEDFEERPGAAKDTALAAAGDEHGTAERLLDEAQTDEAMAEELDAAADEAVVEAVVADTAAQDALDWLDANPKATAEEYEQRQEDLEKIVHPIFSKIHGAGAGGAGGDDDDEMPDHDDL